VEDYPPIDASAISVCKKGIPDSYNFLPSRLITQEEAKARGWTYYFEGQICRHGHMAPRFVSNPRSWVDCNRIKRTRQPIGAKAPAVVNVQEEEIRSPAPAAVDVLEERPGIRPSAPAALAFKKWTAEKRARLIERWVDTGDIAGARDAIGVTPSEYLRELDRNEDFAEAVRRAEPLANRILEERAYELALAGNDKLLTKVLAAKFPNQYRESVKLDIMQTSRVAAMTDEQIEARIRQLQGKRDAIDVEVEPAKQLLAPNANRPQ
jgi:hypothetical protein